MRSIRWSLVVYFLVLLAISSAAVSGLAYQYTQAALAKKEYVQKAALDRQYAKEDLPRIEKKLDPILWWQWRHLASQAQSHFQGTRRWRQTVLAPLNLLACGVNSVGCLTAPVYFGDRANNPWLRANMQAAYDDIPFDKDALPNPENLVAYFQIDSETGTTWRSQSMRDKSFPFDPASLDRMELHKMNFEDKELSGDEPIRLLTVKISLARPGPPGGRANPDSRPERGTEMGFQRPTPREDRRRERPNDVMASRPAPRGLGGESRPPAAQPQELLAPYLLIRCAVDATQRKRELADLWQKLKDDKAEVEKESASQLGQLRDLLLLLGIGMFAGVLLGGYGLVWLGLSPLRRLSEAVSRVSAKDFRLNFSDKQLPSELKPIVSRLTETLDLLKRAFAREKQAAADISHDLRTPLAALLTTIEVGLRKPRSPEEYRELLVDCRGACKQMNHLVERLLALSRLDSGMDRLRSREVDVANLAEQCVSLVRPLAQARGLTLDLHCDPLQPVRIDPDKLREILTNLLHNAIEYNRPRGSVDLTVQRQNGSLELDVRDTGIGVAPEIREHIFERFYRADPSRQLDGMHAGLGLAIVKGYVDLMGGTIAVDSTPGAGSVFRLTLPVEDVHTEIEVPVPL